MSLWQMIIMNVITVEKSFHGNVGKRFINRLVESQSSVIFE